ncbi:hypothetical protein Rsub_01134 [Raphidocelis subcapitata]|uniref:Uncharacterized protein n=1 Tax=Raphidocelis subcapitata TaxID=307507 RepID=A0A2V0NPF7_9CHLO|nr:hypothetical protein Rsub_01134 [Raphidocelis subcapitata]|eukprot:GBF88422.1 hypothetical protein Rsub_01134 [Raphidocelis subcapitata]
MNFGFEKKRGSAKALADLQRQHRNARRQVEELQNQVQELRAKEAALELVAATLEELAEVTAPLLDAATAASAAASAAGGDGGSGAGGDAWGPDPGLVRTVVSILRERLQTLPLEKGSSTGAGSGSGSGSGEAPPPAGSAGAGPVACPALERAPYPRQPRPRPGWAAHLMLEGEGGPAGALQRLRQSKPEDVSRARGDIIRAAAMDVLHMRAGGPTAAVAEARLSEAFDRSIALLVAMLAANPAGYARALALRMDTCRPLEAVMDIGQCRAAVREMGLSEQQGRVTTAIHSWCEGIQSHIAARRTELLEKQRQASCSTDEALEAVAELELGQVLMAWGAVAASCALYAKVLTPTQAMVGACAMYPASLTLMGVALTVAQAPDP